jgi:hypothetical protein
LESFHLERLLMSYWNENGQRIVERDYLLNILKTNELNHFLAGVRLAVLLRHGRGVGVELQADRDAKGTLLKNSLF